MVSWLRRLGHLLTARTADEESLSIDTLTTSDAFGRGPLPHLRVRLIVLAEQLVATVRTDVVRVRAHSHDLLFQTSLDVFNAACSSSGLPRFETSCLGNMSERGAITRPKNLQRRLNVWPVGNQPALQN